MNTGRTFNGLGFLLRWVLANMVALGVALPLVIALANANYGLALISVGGVGLGVGTAQWFAARKQIKRPVLWILASTAGWEAGWFLSWIVMFVLTIWLTLSIPSSQLKTRTELALIAYGFFFAIVTAPGWMIGICTGLSQWIALIGQVNRAERWIMASALGWGIGWVAFVFLWLQALAFPGVDLQSIVESFAKMNTQAIFVAAVVGVMTGCLSGGLTGIALVRLLRNPTSHPA